MANIPIFCFFSSFYFEISRQNVKLGRYWAYCTRNQAITNAYIYIVLSITKKKKKKKKKNATILVQTILGETSL